VAALQAAGPRNQFFFTEINQLSEGRQPARFAVQPVVERQWYGKSQAPFRSSPPDLMDCGFRI
jgi:hypothetical protein